MPTPTWPSLPSWSSFRNAFKIPSLAQFRWTLACLFSHRTRQKTRIASRANCSWKSCISRTSPNVWIQGASLLYTLKMRSTYGAAKIWCPKMGKPTWELPRNGSHFCSNTNELADRSIMWHREKREINFGRLSILRDPCRRQTPTNQSLIGPVFI